MNIVHSWTLKYSVMTLVSFTTLDFLEFNNGLVPFVCLDLSVPIIVRTTEAHSVQSSVSCRPFARCWLLPCLPGTVWLLFHRLGPRTSVIVILGKPFCLFPMLDLLFPQLHFGRASPPFKDMACYKNTFILCVMNWTVFVKIHISKSWPSVLQNGTVLKSEAAKR